MKKKISPKRSQVKKTSPKRSQVKKTSPKRSQVKKTSVKKTSPKTKVQKIIFSKNKWTYLQSKNWLKKHNYDWDYLWYTDNNWHYELYQSKKGKKYRTINFSKEGDIKAVLEILP
jgi:hypothetical protein